MIPTRACPYCAASQPASAAFCGACGQEFRAPRRRPDPPPPVPSVERRFRSQGGAAIRVVVALIAAFVVAIPVTFLSPSESADWLLLDAAMAAVVLACVALERGALAPALRASGGLGWLLLAAALAWPLQALGALWFALLEGALGGLDGEAFWEKMPAWLLWVSVVFVPAVFEELAFRGVFLRSAKHFLRPLPAHLLTAAAFAAIHVAPLALPFHFSIGLALGFLRERSGSLWPPMVLHAVNNALALGLIPGGP